MSEMSDDIQYVKSVSGTWHIFAAYGRSADDGGMLAQTQCDRLVKVARLQNKQPAGRMLNPMSFCTQCRWHQQRSE